MMGLFEDDENVKSVRKLQQPKLQKKKIAIKSVKQIGQQKISGDVHQGNVVNELPVAKSSVKKDDTRIVPQINYLEEE